VSELVDSIQRQRWMEVKGHSGREKLTQRSIKLDRVFVKIPKKSVEILTNTEFLLTYDSKGLQKWLKSG